MIALLSVAGAAIAAYLTYARFSGATIACATGGCETVQESSYATLAGVPVAVLGLAGYAAIFATTLVKSHAAAVAGAVLGVSGFLFSMYLLYAQVLVIEAVCQWCVASDAVLGVLAVTTLARAFAFPPHPRPA